MKDALELYEDYLWKQEEELLKLPVCCMCGEHIQTEWLYEICGDLYCEDCIDDCKKSVDSFMD